MDSEWVVLDGRDILTGQGLGVWPWRVTESLRLKAIDVVCVLDRVRMERAVDRLSPSFDITAVTAST